jgi:type IV secretory pathway VirJ component
MGQIPGAQLVLLPKVGHGYSVERNWMPQFLAEFHRLTAPAADAPPPPPPAIADLPVVEVPSATEGGDTFAVIVSGDGGWAGLDRNVARTLSERGIPVVGIDSLRYFWTARDPDGFGADLARLIRFYLAQWKRESVYLIGYSQGGDVLPFGVNRLPADLRARVKLIAPLAPAEKAAFEFHLTNWVGGHGDIPLMPEMEKLEHDPALVCIWGRDEGGSICPKLDAAKFRVIGLPGAHHFNGDYKTVAETLLKSAVK